MQAATVSVLRKIVSDRTGIPPEEMRIMYGGKDLRDEMSVSDYNIQEESTLFVVVRLLGGMPPKGLKPGIATTPNPCVILYTDDEDDPRAKMNCRPGHGITSEAMTSYLQSILAQGRAQVTCPECTGPWDFTLCVNVANVTAEEKQRFEETVSRNYADKYVCDTVCVCVCVTSCAGVARVC